MNWDFFCRRTREHINFLIVLYLQRRNTIGGVLCVQPGENAPMCVTAECKPVVSPERYSNPTLLYNIGSWPSMQKRLITCCPFSAQPSVNSRLSDNEMTSWRDLIDERYWVSFFLSVRPPIFRSVDRTSHGDAAVLIWSYQDFQLDQIGSNCPCKTVSDHLCDCCLETIITRSRPCNDTLPLKLILLAVDRSSQQQVVDPRRARTMPTGSCWILVWSTVCGATVCPLPSRHTGQRTIVLHAHRDTWGRLLLQIYIAEILIESKEMKFDPHRNGLEFGLELFTLVHCYAARSMFNEVVLVANGSYIVLDFRCPRGGTIGHERNECFVRCEM